MTTVEKQHMGTCPGHYGIWYKTNNNNYYYYAHTSPKAPVVHTGQGGLSLQVMNIEGRYSPAFTQKLSSTVTITTISVVVTSSQVTFLMVEPVPHVTEQSDSGPVAYW